MPVAKDGPCLDCKTSPRTGKGRCTPCRSAFVKAKRESGEWKIFPSKDYAKPKPPKPEPEYDWAMVERVMSGRESKPPRLTRRERFEVVRLVLRAEPETFGRHRAVEAVGSDTAVRWFNRYREHAEKFITYGPLVLDWPKEFSSEQLGI